MICRNLIALFILIKTTYQVCQSEIDIDCVLSNPSPRFVIADRTITKLNISSSIEIEDGLYFSNVTFYVCSFTININGAVSITGSIFQQPQKCLEDIGISIICQSLILQLSEINSYTLHSNLTDVLMNIIAQSITIHNLRIVNLDILNNFILFMSTHNLDIDNLSLITSMVTNGGFFIIYGRMKPLVIKNVLVHKNKFWNSSLCVFQDYSKFLQYDSGLVLQENDDYLIDKLVVKENIFDQFQMLYVTILNLLTPTYLIFIGTNMGVTVRDVNFDDNKFLFQLFCYIFQIEGTTITIIELQFINNTFEVLYFKFVSANKVLDGYISNVSIDPTNTRNLEDITRNIDLLKRLVSFFMDKQEEMEKAKKEMFRTLVNEYLIFNQQFKYPVIFVECFESFSLRFNNLNITTNQHLNFEFIKIQGQINALNLNIHNVKFGRETYAGNDPVSFFLNVNGIFSLILLGDILFENIHYDKIDFITFSTTDQFLPSKDFILMFKNLTFSGFQITLRDTAILALINIQNIKSIKIQFVNIRFLNIILKVQDDSQQNQDIKSFLQHTSLIYINAINSTVNLENIVIAKVKLNYYFSYLKVNSEPCYNLFFINSNQIWIESVQIFQLNTDTFVQQNTILQINSAQQLAISKILIVKAQNGQNGLAQINCFISTNMTFRNVILHNFDLNQMDHSIYLAIAVFNDIQTNIVIESFQITNCCTHQNSFLFQVIQTNLKQAGFISLMFKNLNFLNGKCSNQTGILQYLGQAQDIQNVTFTFEFISYLNINEFREINTESRPLFEIFNTQQVVIQFSIFRVYANEDSVFQIFNSETLIINEMRFKSKTKQFKSKTKQFKPIKEIFQLQEIMNLRLSGLKIMDSSQDTLVMLQNISSGILLNCYLLNIQKEKCCSDLIKIQDSVKISFRQIYVQNIWNMTVFKVNSSSIEFKHTQIKGIYHPKPLFNECHLTAAITLNNTNFIFINSHISFSGIGVLRSIQNQSLIKIIEKSSIFNNFAQCYGGIYFQTIRNPVISQDTAIYNNKDLYSNQSNYFGPPNDLKVEIFLIKRQEFISTSLSVHNDIHNMSEVRKGEDIEINIQFAYKSLINDIYFLRHDIKPTIEIRFKTQELVALNFIYYKNMKYVTNSISLVKIQVFYQINLLLRRYKLRFTMSQSKNNNSKIILQSQTLNIGIAKLVRFQYQINVLFVLKINFPQLIPLFVMIAYRVEYAIVKNNQNYILVGLIISVEPGYWRESNTSLSIYYCGNNPRNCHSTEQSPCLEGTLGPLCETCDFFAETQLQSYSRVSNYSCLGCEQQQNNNVKLGLYITALIITLILLSIFNSKGVSMYLAVEYLRFLRIFHFGTSGLVQLQGIYIKILINHLQVYYQLFITHSKILSSLAMIQIMDAGPFQIIAKGLFQSSRLITLDVFNFDCLYRHYLIPNNSFPFKAQLISFLIPVLTFILMLAQIGLFIRRISVTQVVYSFIFLFFYFYPEVSRKLFQTITCRNIDNKSLLSLYLRQQCYNSEHYFYLFVVFLPIFIIAIVLPCLILLQRLVRDKKHMNILSYNFTMKYGIIFSQFNQKGYFFEFVKIVQKLIIALIVTIFIEEPITTFICIILVNILYSTSQQKINPFISSQIQTLDYFSILVLNISFILMILIQKVSVKDLSIILYFLILVINFTIFGFLGFFLLRRFLIKNRLMIGSFLKRRTQQYQDVYKRWRLLRKKVKSQQIEENAQYRNTSLPILQLSESLQDSD